MESSTNEIKLNDLEDEHTTKETKETTTEEEGSIGFTSIKEVGIVPTCSCISVYLLM